jgi:hypothetical protein
MQAKNAAPLTEKVLHGHQYGAAERKKIDRLMRRREILLKRFGRIERDLAAIERAGAVIKKHCTATPNERAKGGPADAHRVCQHSLEHRVQLAGFPHRSFGVQYESWRE